MDVFMQRRVARKNVDKKFIIVDVYMIVNHVDYAQN